LYFLCEKKNKQKQGKPKLDDNMILFWWLFIYCKHGRLLFELLSTYIVPQQTKTETRQNIYISEFKRKKTISILKTQQPNACKMIFYVCKNQEITCINLQLCISQLIIITSNIARSNTVFNLVKSCHHTDISVFNTTNTEMNGMTISINFLPYEEWISEIFFLTDTYWYFFISCIRKWIQVD
jgi:hypothetical protein